MPEGTPVGDDPPPPPTPLDERLGGGVNICKRAWGFWLDIVMLPLTRWGGYTLTGQRQGVSATEFAEALSQSQGRGEPMGQLKTLMKNKTTVAIDRPFLPSSISTLTSFVDK
jgi:hypothetical protein